MIHPRYRLIPPPKNKKNQKNVNAEQNVILEGMNIHRFIYLFHYKLLTISSNQPTQK